MSATVVSIKPAQEPGPETPLGTASLGPRGVFGALLREPLFHFLVAGAVIFGIAEAVEHHYSQYRIVVTPQQQLRVVESYRQQYGALPSPEQRDTLLRNFVKEEILYREALALGLDRDDEIVRRRLAQKFSFLQQDLVMLQEPAAADLERFYSDNRGAYAQLERRALRHVYFSPDKGGDQAARERAAAALAVLRAGPADAAADPGDTFAGLNDIPQIDADTAERLFGRSELVTHIYSAPVGEWVGPYRSGFGWHIFRVESRSPGRQLPFSEVAERVRQDYQDSRRNALNERALADVAAKYTVVTASVEP
jgi:peptidyl-prolyl cis-trans isomerase C